jgi:hypothetical protein
MPRCLTLVIQLHSFHAGQRVLLLAFVTFLCFSRAKQKSAKRRLDEKLPGGGSLGRIALQVACWFPFHLHAAAAIV